MTNGLAPNPRSKFKAYDYDPADMEGTEWFDLPFNPGAKIRGYTVVNEANCQIVYEDFMPGSEFQWTFIHDEFQYAVAGEIEIEVFEPPLFQESTVTRFKAGTVCSFPLGARMHVKVIGDEPFRHICFCSPNPDYPFPTIEALRGLK